jgi:DNA-binding NarL/FixJ family response regulator
MTIRVGVADDQALIRDGLRAQLGLVADMTVVGEASTGAQAVALARRELPDVLLMDVRMPELDGIEAARVICSDPALRGVHVVVLTTYDEDENVYAAVRAGASGFLLKDVTPEALHNAIRACAAGEAVVAPRVTRRLLDEIGRRPVRGRAGDALAALTARETEVLRLVAEGLSNAEISGRLFLSPATTKTHVSRILTKLGARDRAQLVAIAYESGLVRPADG